MPEDSHLLLGISFEGIVLVMQRLGLYDHVTRTASPSYVRGDDLAWVTQVCGDAPVGYDCCNAVREWLKARGAEDLSVCEVLATDRDVADLHCHVGEANLENLEVSTKNLDYQQRGLLAGERTLPPEGQRFYWVDYFCLKQCCSDFDPHKIVALIQRIGCTVAQLDDAMLERRDYNDGDPPSMYLTRSFCVLELYASWSAKPCCSSLR